MNVITRLTVALAVSLALSSAYAQQDSATSEEAAESPDRLDTVTVVGTRTERSLKELSATISVITSEDLEREVSRDIADLVRYEPGVSVSGTGSRFGLSGFSIRGIGGNRVHTMVDGVRVPDEFSFGPFLSARRDFVDIDSLERVEIARGPISSLYGSDAIGGVVAFTTRSAIDYLDDGRPYYGGFKAGYSSADESVVGTLTLAAGNEQLSGMVVYTSRDYSESENQGSIGGTGPARELPDPFDSTTENILAKISFRASDQHLFTIGVENYDSETESQILSDYGAVVFGTLINSRDAIDTRNRTRVSLHYEFTGETPLADSIVATIYDQQSDSEQFTFEARTTPSAESQRRERLSIFEQELQGALLQASKGFSIGDSEHVLTYGVDYYTTESAGLRDGGSFDAGGNPIPEFFPLPTRDFPPTETEQTAFFIQNEISLLDGRLLVTPGIRYDSFDADATADAIYLSGNPGQPEPVDFDDSEATGRIGFVYSFNENIVGYAQYSEGFRAPPYDDVNIGFSNFISGYKSISNPDLRSERSEGIELGLRFEGSAGSASLGAFMTDYDDFIESQAIAPAFLPSGIDPADGLLTFQSINREKVEIDGIEFSGALRLGVLSERLDGFELRTAIAYADGEDTSNGEPINSIEPLSGVIGVAYAADSNRWGGEVVLTLVDGKDEGDIDSRTTLLQTAGYGTVDLLAWAQFTDNVSVNVGLFNITDKEYIRWADAGGIGGDAAIRFTQPGFNAGATVRVEF